MALSLVATPMAESDGEVVGDLSSSSDEVAGDPAPSHVRRSRPTVFRGALQICMILASATGFWHDDPSLLSLCPLWDGDESLFAVGGVLTYTNQIMSVDSAVTGESHDVMRQSARNRARGASVSGYIEYPCIKTLQLKEPVAIDQTSVQHVLANILDSEAVEHIIGSGQSTERVCGKFLNSWQKASKQPPLSVSRSELGFGSGSGSLVSFPRCRASKPLGSSSTFATRSLY